jgi:hypothetical protein
VTGQETFELAAAIAGVCIGLAALIIFSLVAIVGAWQVFRRAGEASMAATKASQGAEELARHLAFQASGQPRSDSSQFAELRQEAAALLEQERRLHEMARELVESGALEGGPSAAALSHLEVAVGRLDATVGQMAASLANLVQLWEQQRR